MKPRVLHLIGSFHQGGTERQALALARMLKRAGSFDVSIATMDRNGVLRPEAEAAFGQVPEFRLTSFHDANFVRQVRALARHLRQNQIEIIHTHDFYTNVFGLAAAKLAGVPVRIASKRETGIMRTRAQDIVEKAAFRAAHAIVANSRAVRGYLTDRGVDPAKIHVIYNGVDLDRFTAASQPRAEVCKKYDLPPRRADQFVTMVANLRHDVKNVPMLLRAASRVVIDLPRTHFVIAGEGGLQSSLQEMSASLGVAKNVHFIGRCDDVPSLLAASSVAVLTSSAEGFSNSILEYMAAAKPVIATNVGGAREAVKNGETGYLIKPDDDTALAKHMIDLLANRKKAEGMGRTGRDAIEARFTSARQLAGVHARYEKEISLAAGRNKVKYKRRARPGSAVLNSQPATDEK